jgi:uncharacterized protein YdaU (DUF1376 family)
MAEHPMFPLWTDAYLGDTLHLSTLEHGAYVLMLITAWRSGVASLPNDPDYLRRVVKMDVRQWAKHGPAILKFWRVDGDRLVQSRLADEWSSCLAHKSTNSAKAKRRWALKRNETGDAVAEQGQSQGNAAGKLSPSPSPKEIKNKEKGPNAPDWRERVQNFKARRHWSSNWGPVPGKPYCDAPSAILKEFGFGA